MTNIKISLPIVMLRKQSFLASQRNGVSLQIAKEGKWFVASCPPLDIATQGLTEQEVKENMADLIKDYIR